MKPLHLLISVGILSLAISYASANSKLIIIQNATHLSSEVANYAEKKETIEVFWIFSHSITLDIDDFHLNGHDGDFILISEHPLVDAEDFIGKNNTELTDADLDKLAKGIVTDQGLLLSWKAKTEIEAVNDLGTFVWFHVEGNDDPDFRNQFSGFEIEVINYDDSITPTTSTTPDPRMPELPGQDVYISKFLDCMEPLKFFSEINKFKERIADIATEYCNETDISLEPEGPIKASEVNIPGPKEADRAGLHYCDISWRNYNTCVEVTFAIRRINSTGHYILPAIILEDMWETKTNELGSGYCPYTPPPGVEDLTALGWIIFLLAVIFCFTLMLVLAWLKNARSLLDYKLPFTKDLIGNQDQLDELTDDKPAPKLVDPRNPMLNFVSKKAYNPPKEDNLHPAGDYLGPRYNPTNAGNGSDDDDAPVGFQRRSFRKNPAFQEAPVDVFAYDNSGFRDDNDATTGRNKAKGHQWEVLGR